MFTVQPKRYRYLEVRLKSKRPMRCVVGPETERMLRLGHPWVLADGFTAKWPKAEAGDLADLINARGESLGTAMLDPKSRVVARLLDRQRITLNTQWLMDRFRAADRARAWSEFGDTTAWRIANAEGDGLPGLCVDRYGEYLLVQYYTRAWEPHLPPLVDALVRLYRPTGLYAKFRPQDTRKLEVDQQARGRLLDGQAAPVGGFTVREHGLIFKVDLVEDMHTGLFPDQRDNRLAFRKRAAGNSVLNLFAYTGAFSVAAAAGGATRVTSVDAAGRYLERARDNFNLNEIDPDRHEFINGDCFAELQSLADAGRQFDIVLMDPPSFSTTRKSRMTATGGTAELVRLSMQLLPPGGLLVCSSNLRKMTLPDYLKELRKGALAAGRSLQVIEIAGQGPDFPFSVTFPEGHYLKYVVGVVQ